MDTAADGVAALDLLARQRPHAMVLDVMMPRLDGLETCRRLRAARDALPVLVLTARDAVSDRVTGLDASADDYLPKPFALEEAAGPAARAAATQHPGRRHRGRVQLRPGRAPR